MGRVSLEYRQEIDGLRAVAVAAVVLYHADFGVRGGLVGVDIFFVISGYLITSLLKQEWEATATIDLLAFYARRVRRLLPALLVVVAATLVAAVFVYAPLGQLQSVAASAAASLMFVGNFFFQKNTGGYFDPQSESFPLLHLWSLGVEEQFYLAWPLVLTLLLRSRARGIGIAISGLALSSLILAEYWMRSDPGQAFFQMPARFWELAIGGLIAFQPRNFLRRADRVALVGALILAVTFAIPSWSYPGLGVAPAVAGAACVILSVHRSHDLGLTGSWLRSRPMVFVGLMSYSLYLWHWPLFAIEHMVHVGKPPAIERMLVCVLAVVLAWGSLRLVEQPTRRGSLSAAPRTIVACGFAMSLAVAYFSIVLGRELNEVPPPSDVASRTERDWPPNKWDCHYLRTDPNDPFPRAGCTSAFFKPLKVVIWGDSHANAWQPLAWLLAAQQDVAATSYTRAMCQPILDYQNGMPALEARRCIEFNNRVVDQLDGIDTLIMTGRWSPNMIDDGLAAKLDATVQAALKKVRRIILLGPTPTLHAFAAKCIRANDFSECEIPRSEFETATRQSIASLRSIAAAHPQVRFVDVSDFFCDQKTCSVMKDGFGLYWDNQHVSSTAARTFAAEFLSNQYER